MGLPGERQRDNSLRAMKPQLSDLVFVREPEPCLVAADVSPQDGNTAPTGAKIPGTVRASPSHGAADEVSVKNKSDSGWGEGERFLQSHFRTNRLITQNP